MPVSEVTSADLLEILTPLWHRKVATAKRVRQRLRAVLEWAVAMKYRIDNPCDRIGPVLGPQQDVTEHMQAVPHREAAAVIRRVRASAAAPAARLAFEFLVLTSARWGEVRWAEWAEIDRHKGVWRTDEVSSPEGTARTAEASGGQADAVKWVSPFQTGGVT